MDKRKLIISIGILVVVGLHAVPLVQRLQGKRQTFWPIMAWGMYRNSRGSGPIQASIRRIIGITSTGEEWEVGPWDAGLSYFAFGRLYLTPMWKGDAFAAQRLADRLDRHRHDGIVEFRLEGETYTLTNSGVIKEDNPVIFYQVAD